MLLENILVAFESTSALQDRLLPDTGQLKGKTHLGSTVSCGVVKTCINSKGAVEMIACDVDMWQPINDP